MQASNSTLNLNDADQLLDAGDVVQRCQVSRRTANRILKEAGGFQLPRTRGLRIRARELEAFFDRLTEGAA